MISKERLTVLVLFVSLGVNGSVVVNGKDEGNNTTVGGFALEKSLSFGGTSEELNLEREIVQEINHLNPRKQREILVDLEKQNEKFNISQKSLVLAETENLSPLNVEELRTIRKTIKANNGSLPAIRNKRTLSFLLRALVRAMGYTLTPSNPDAEWIPRQQPPPAQPCTTPPPPCSPPSTPPPCPPPPCNPPSTPPPCPPPPCNPPPSTPPPCPPPSTPPPCTGSKALILAPTIPPSQIDPNTISYPYRRSRTIPLFNFAPLPAGVRVPYPPLLQPPARQRASCPPPQQPSPCAPPSTTPPPCQPSPPPCTTPAPSPPPCTTPAPSPPPCQTTPAPPCGTTPAPKPPPCQPSPPPCQPSPPPPKTPPCQTTPAPPPPCTTPAPTQPPCPPPSPPPCATPAPPPPPSDPPKKGSILLEYDDPVRIQIFSNDKKYLPASGNIFSGSDEDNGQDWHSYFYPEKEKARKKDEDYEEKEEMEEEHITEEEEDDEAPGQLKHYEEEDERSLAAEEEDESETSLSIVKKPMEKDERKAKKGRMIGKGKKSEKEEGKESEKGQKMKKPKRKKWIRIVKKQRRKTKTDSSPDSNSNNNSNFQIYSSDSFSEASEISPRYYEKRNSRFAFDSYETDVSDFSSSSSEPEDSSSSRSTEVLDLKKVTINNKQIKPPQHPLQDTKPYEFNFNPFAPEPEEERRKKLEKAVERYVEDYVEEQLGNELIKNTGVPKTTVFEFKPRNGPKIQTITTTVAKTTGNPRSGLRPRNRYAGNSPRGPRKSGYEGNSKKRGNYGHDEFVVRV